jgi:hypothetical protein
MAQQNFNPQSLTFGHNRLDVSHVANTTVTVYGVVEEDGKVLDELS